MGESERVPFNSQLMKEHTKCRVCGSEKMIPYIDLGMMPLSNNLASSSVDKIHGEKYPLKVLLCSVCNLSQLSIVIEPEKMFGHYEYRSSISQGYKDHCMEMAISLQKKHELNKDSFHIDIAGNDGALLEQFRNVIGCKILNVDPALNLAGICQAAHIPVITKFWGTDAVQHILSNFGKADLITATNVFAHVDDVKDFLEAVKQILKPGGVLVMEFPYLIDFIEGKEFDTIYFEHLSYFSIFPLQLLCNSVGLSLMDVEKHKIHGGSVRVTIGYGEQSDSVSCFIKNETDNYSSIEPYQQFSKDVRAAIANFFRKYHSLNGVKAGFAASAKGNTLLNSAGITVASMRYIVDETPGKIGKYSPGTHIPIVGMADMIRTPPDYLVILSWNFAEEIKDKCRKAGYTGKFIIPIPEFLIVD